MIEYNEREIANGGRLAFFNPNGVNGSIDGVPLTPNYEDLCISVNLIVELVDRFKNNMTTSTDEKIVISWNSQKGEEKSNYISFLSGTDANEFCDGISGEYLTTYYTDINVNDVIENNIVEGLGITNVDISYDNMYMPTITIKFVDVRGSGLFAREESVHENDKITSETIFGCFFTLPYPKFKLQVKGFYGDAVTYQLACTSFKARFNSQTGNFEITTSFIGYQYSLLTDIPFAYIMAAPYCSYVGEEYWNAHVNSEDWVLTGGDKPQKLFEIYKNLKSSMREDQKGIIGTDFKINGNNATLALEELKEMWDVILNSIRSNGNYVGYTKNDNEGFLDTQNHRHYLIMTSGVGGDGINVGNMKINNNDNMSVMTALGAVQGEINNFNHFYSKEQLKLNIDTKFIDQNLIAKNIVTTAEVEDISNNFISTQIQKDDSTILNTIGKSNINGNSNITSVPFQMNGGWVNVFNSDQLELIKPRELRDYIFQQYSDNSGWSSTESYTGIKVSNSLRNPYVTTICDYGLIYQIDQLLKKIETDKNNTYINDIDDNAPEKVCDIIGFKPYLGNFMKVIMAHLETLTEMIYQCANNIINQMESGLRDVGYLNININNTDISNSMLNITPFPAIYKQATEGNNNNPYDVLAWVGEISAYFEEEKFINALHKAVLKNDNNETTESNNKLSSITTINAEPLAPADFYLKTPLSCFNETLNINEISTLLCLRFAQLYSAYPNNDLKWFEIGEKDAKNIGALNPLVNQYDNVAFSTLVVENVTTHQDENSCYYYSNIIKGEETNHMFCQENENKKSVDYYYINSEHNNKLYNIIPLDYNIKYIPKYLSANFQERDNKYKKDTNTTLTIVDPVINDNNEYSSKFITVPIDLFNGMDESLKIIDTEVTINTIINASWYLKEFVNNLSSVTYENFGFMMMPKKGKFYNRIQSDKYNISGEDYIDTDQQQFELMFYADYIKSKYLSSIKSVNTINDGDFITQLYLEGIPIGMHTCMLQDYGDLDMYIKMGFIIFSLRKEIKISEIEKLEGIIVVPLIRIIYDYLYYVIFHKEKNNIKDGIRKKLNECIKSKNEKLEEVYLEPKCLKEYYINNCEQIAEKWLNTNSKEIINSIIGNDRSNNKVNWKTITKFNGIYQNFINLFDGNLKQIPDNDKVYGSKTQSENGNDDLINIPIFENTKYSGMTDIMKRQCLIEYLNGRGDYARNKWCGKTEYWFTNGVIAIWRSNARMQPPLKELLTKQCAILCNVSCVSYESNEI